MRDQWLNEIQSLLREAFQRQRELKAQLAGAADDPLVVRRLSSLTLSGHVLRPATADAAADIDTMSNEARAALSDAELREHLTQEFCAAVAEESAYADQLRQAMVYIETLRHRKLEPTREAQSLFRSVHALWALHEQRALPPIAALNPLPERDAVDGEGRLQVMCLLCLRLSRSPPN